MAEYLGRERRRYARVTVTRPATARPLQPATLTLALATAVPAGPALRRRAPSLPARAAALTARGAAALSRPMRLGLALCGGVTFVAVRLAIVCVRAAASRSQDAVST